MKDTSLKNFMSSAGNNAAVNMVDGSRKSNAVELKIEMLRGFIGRLDDEIAQLRAQCDPYLSAATSEPVEPIPDPEDGLCSVGIDIHRASISLLLFCKQLQNLRERLG